MYCNVCDITLVCYKSSLIDHAESIDHQNACKVNNIPVILDFTKPFYNEVIEKEAVDHLKFAAFHCDMNLPFGSSKIMAKKLSNMDSTSMFTDLKAGATRISNLVVNVISPNLKKDFANVLKMVPFCICLDESTDVSKQKVLVITTRYTDRITGKCEKKMWDMPKVFLKGMKADAGAERIFNCVKESFEKYDVPVLNIVACCTDGCKTMTGHIKGFKKRLKEIFSHVIFVTCPAHYTHLCATHASPFLPKEVIELVTNIYTLLNSANKLQNFEVIQIELELPLHKILKYIYTRWLAMLYCVDRNLEQWPAIEQFAQNQDDKLAKKIYAIMQKDDTKCYFFLLRYVLTILMGLNQFFQRADVIITVVSDEVEKTYKNLLSCVMDRRYILNTPASEIDILAQERYLAFVDFELGHEIREKVLENGANMSSFFAHALQFIFSLCYEFKERFNNFKNIFGAFKCLHPPNAVNKRFHETNIDLFELYLATFRFWMPDNATKNKITKQWHDLLTNANINPIKSALMKAPEFWIFVRDLVDENEEYIFYELGALALMSLSVPHANADPERFFSTMNFVKNEKKNSMLSETVDAVIRVREHCRSCDDNAGGFIPSQPMVDDYISKDFYKKRKVE